MAAQIIRNVIIWRGKNRQRNNIFEKVGKFKEFALQFTNCRAILSINDEKCFFLV